MEHGGLGGKRLGRRERHSGLAHHVVREGGCVVLGLSLRGFDLDVLLEELLEHLAGEGGRVALVRKLLAHLELGQQLHSLGLEVAAELDLLGRGVALLHGRGHGVVALLRPALGGLELGGGGGLLVVAQIVGVQILPPVLGHLLVLDLD